MTVIPLHRGTLTSWWRRLWPWLHRHRRAVLVLAALLSAPLWNPWVQMIAINLGLVWLLGKLFGRRHHTSTIIVKSAD